MEFVVHIVTSAIVLLLVSRLLAGFQISNWFTALLTALILAVVHAMMTPLAAYLGRSFGEMLAQTALAYPLKIVMIVAMTLVINALVLKLVAAFGPGFYIDNFSTAIVAAVLMVLFNVLIGEAAEFLQSYLSSVNQAAPG
jgi:putative membrane protein